LRKGQSEREGAEEGEGEADTAGSLPFSLTAERPEHSAHTD